MQSPPAIASDAEVSFSFDGMAVRSAAGRNLAAALLALGHRTLRLSPGRGGPRGAFCMMGICQECVVWVDGRRAPACRTPVRDGLTVRTSGPPPPAVLRDDAAAAMPVTP